MKPDTSRRMRHWNYGLAVAIALASCLAPATGGQAISPSAVSLARPVLPQAAQVTVVPTTTPSPLPGTAPTQSIRIERNSQPPASRIEVNVATATPTVAASPTPASAEAVAAEEEPFITGDVPIGQKCGHLDIAADDGHSLRASPHITIDNSNFLALLPKDTRVDLIDCRLWTNWEEQTWVAVRTEHGKLGWMLVQPDKVYVHILPVTQAIPRPYTGIAPGATAGYAPPAECNTESASTESLATSIGIDFIPVIGDVKGLAEAATGCDLVTGEPLGDWRWLGLLGVIGLAEVATLRHTDDAADLARAANNVDDAASATHAAGKVDEAAEVAGVAKAVSKIEDAADSGGDAIRAATGSPTLVEEAAMVAAKFEQPCSFSGDTLVATSSGQKPISDIEPGELVKAYHGGLNTSGFYPVTAAFTHVDRAIMYLTIGGETIATTPEHPFAVGGVWVPAAALEIGERIAASSGSDGLLTAIHTESRPQVMFNLTVADAHTYYVGEGEWLVHNACARILRQNMQGKIAAWTNEVDWQAHHVVVGSFESHPFVKRATEAGWDINGANNGVALPLQSVVNGNGHPVLVPSNQYLSGAYRDTLEKELHHLESAAVSGHWSNTKAKQELESLVAAKRRSLELDIAPNQAMLQIINKAELHTISIRRLPPGADTTINLIKKGGPFPHPRDGIVFRNKEGLLPAKPDGYYREYTIYLPEARDRGMHRIVAGSSGEFYYTADHYHTFYIVEP